MSQDSTAYGLWPLVVINTAVVILVTFSLAHLRTARDWRSFSAFSAFLVALLTEMYGFPHTIYLLAGWLSGRYSGVDLLSHSNGHIWEVLFGWKGDAHLAPPHLLSYVLIGGGSSWSPMPGRCCTAASASIDWQRPAPMPASAIPSTSASCSSYLDS